jgi:nitrogen regulatory protein PII
MIPDSVVEPAVAAIQKAAHTGKPGDGRIFVIDIEYAVSIRTGEREL